MIQLKYDYKGITMTGKSVYQKIGIYRTGISRYINYKNLEVIDNCLGEDGTNQDFIIYLNLQKKILDIMILLISITNVKIFISQ